mgnify:CR=1 FL=1
MNLFGQALSLFLFWFLISMNVHSGTINFGKVLACGTEAAKAGCVKPTKPPKYYVEQSIKYFRTMETSVSVMVQPNYSEKVVRWEWEPWLLLTGYGKSNLIWTSFFYPQKSC